MNPIIHKRPEPVLETLALLYIDGKRDELALLLESILGEYSPNVVEELRRHEKLHKKYIEAFSEERRDGEFSDFLFNELGLGDYMLIVFCFLLNRNLVYLAESMTESELADLLKASYEWHREYDLLGAGLSDMDFETYIENNSDMKKIADSPKIYLSAAAELVRLNIPACENAWDCVRVQAQNFLTGVWDCPKEFFDKSVLSENAPIKEVYPQLSIYTTSFIVDGIFYYGLFNIDARTDSERQDGKRFVTEVCKAVGDKTRTEILYLISEKPRYNKELAELLGLTSATVLHHLDILFQCGLIKMNADGKDKKRIYYELNKEQVKRFTFEFERLIK